MARAADDARWRCTLAVLAQIYNVYRDPRRSQAIDLSQFFPPSLKPRAERPPPPTAEEREMLRRAFSRK